MSAAPQPAPSAQLRRPEVLAAAAQAAADHFGAPWQPGDFRGLDPYASHPAALLWDAEGQRPVFAKLSDAPHAQHQLEAEVAGLRLLAEQAGALIPAPIAIMPLAGGCLLLLEALPQIERGPEQWREIGRALARVHRVTGAACGLERACYFGPLYQDNRPLPDWPDFFAQRRLWPRLVGAIDSGHLPGEAIALVERLIDRLPALDLPAGPSALLHGDAQQNNFISTAQGAALIDPSAHYGHPEYDLAQLDFFAPVPPEVFAGYQEVLPIDPGFARRKELWRIPTYLAMVQVAGPAELGPLLAAVKAYL